MKLITESNRKWWVLSAMTTAISMIFVDITVLPVVLPTLHRELGISDLGLQWVINAYTLVLTVFVLIGGKFGDMWGYRRSFCAGASLFALASALCGLSHSGGWLIASRALQGLGGALLLPATQALIISHFPPHQRGKAIGIFVSIGSIFLSLGPLIGGSLTQYYSWRLVFLINLPIALLGLLMALFAVPRTNGQKETFDFPGFLTLSLGITSLIVGVMQSQVWGWLSFKTVGLILAGCALIYYMYRKEQQVERPLIDFSLMRVPSFFAGSGCIFLAQFLLIINVFWAIYFQNVLGFSASKAGAFSFMASMPTLCGGPIAGFLVDRYGPRLPVMGGFAIFVCALIWLITQSTQASAYHLLPALLLFGIAAPMVFTPSFVGLMNDVPAEKRGVASGINAAIRQFGSTLGMAVFGTLFTTFQTSRFKSLVKASPITESLNPEPFQELLYQSETAMDVFNGLSPITQKDLMQSALDAFLHGFSIINGLSATLALIGFFFAWRYLKNQKF
ncbi:MAG: MFS transporter [Verrucomicrobia bacterium]|nr:MFS transporter [Verrucomicrobiota bacterium]